MTQFLPGEVGTITVDFSSYPAPSFRIITSVTFPSVTTALSFAPFPLPRTDNSGAAVYPLPPF